MQSLQLVSWDATVDGSRIRAVGFSMDLRADSGGNYRPGGGPGGPRMMKPLRFATGASDAMSGGGRP